jgi:hypothetical protein
MHILMLERNKVMKFLPSHNALHSLAMSFFQILASLACILFATWFGPVSLVGPIFFSAQLEANMIIFGFVLSLENLRIEMHLGTYVIVVSTILLPIVGNGIKGGQNAQYLFNKGYAIVWSLVLLGGMFGSAIYVFSVTPWTHIFQPKNVLEIHHHSPHCQIHLLYAQSNERPVESLFYSQALRSSFYPSLSRLSRVLYTHGPFAFNRPICATQCNNAHVGKCHNRNHCMGRLENC